MTSTKRGDLRRATSHQAETWVDTVEVYDVQTVYTLASVGAIEGAINLAIGREQQGRNYVGFVSLHLALRTTDGPKQEPGWRVGLVFAPGTPKAVRRRVWKTIHTAAAASKAKARG